MSTVGATIFIVQAESLLCGNQDVRSATSRCQVGLNVAKGWGEADWRGLTAQIAPASSLKTWNATIRDTIPQIVACFLTLQFLPCPWIMTCLLLKLLST